MPRLTAGPEMRVLVTCTLNRMFLSFQRLSNCHIHVGYMRLKVTAIAGVAGILDNRTEELDNFSLG